MLILKDEEDINNESSLSWLKKVTLFKFKPSLFSEVIKPELFLRVYISPGSKDKICSSNVSIFNRSLEISLPDGAR